MLTGFQNTTNVFIAESIIKNKGHNNVYARITPIVSNYSYTERFLVCLSNHCSRLQNLYLRRLTFKKNVTENRRSARESSKKITMKDLLSKSYGDIIDRYKTEDFREVLKRGYVFQFDENEKNAELLFIGMNPSYTKKHEEGKTYADIYTRNVDRSYFKAFNQNLLVFI